MSNLSRAALLINQNKYDLAEKEIKMYMVNNPNDGLSFSYLALTYIGLQKVSQALEAAQQGISLSPYSAFAFYVLTKCYIEKEELSKAAEAILNALRLDPTDADYLCTYASILDGQRKRDEALVTVNKALQVNPEHNHAKKVKSHILRKMGRHKEADAYATEALSEDPEDALSFSTKGWALLDSGNPKDALEYFKNSLMLNPTNEYAKSGLVLSMKARYTLFNIFYQYYNWVSQLSSGVRWGLAIGLVVLMRIAGNIGDSNSDFAPVFGIIVTLYICFVFLAWNIDPVFNMLLRFNKYGRYALDKGQIILSNIILGLLFSAVVQYGLTFIFPLFPLLGAIGSLFLTIAYVGAFRFWDTPKFKKNFAYSLFLTFLLVVSILSKLVNPEAPTTTYLIFIVGTVGYTWVIGLSKR